MWVDSASDSDCLIEVFRGNRHVVTWGIDVWCFALLDNDETITCGGVVSWHALGSNDELVLASSTIIFSSDMLGTPCGVSELIVVDGSTSTRVSWLILSHETFALVIEFSLSMTLVSSQFW